MARRRIEYTGMEQCEMCGSYHHQMEMESAEDGTMYCPTCAAQMIVTCQCCGGTDHLWNMTGYDDAGNYYCENCAIAV